MMIDKVKIFSFLYPDYCSSEICVFNGDGGLLFFKWGVGYKWELENCGHLMILLKIYIKIPVARLD